ncbi:hypothetical protein [Actinopolymorpha pittospori]|uniref:Uncharacterized protein n=1 Tax=Actinopolymorpha pittospori TaxID=648752 RepID=A0A927RBX2_9ACTN|nr:hypothetical protein [Actinopolymorpha pittospori]MBE1606525.1 hypothetical protein [Actinopolymorpha pittospori]
MPTPLSIATAAAIATNRRTIFALVMTPATLPSAGHGWRLETLDGQEDRHREIAAEAEREGADIMDLLSTTYAR